MVLFDGFMVRMPYICLMKKVKTKPATIVRITLRLPKDVYKKVEEQAATNNRSINGEIITRLQSA